MKKVEFVDTSKSFRIASGSTSSKKRKKKKVAEPQSHNLAFPLDRPHDGKSNETNALEDMITFVSGKKLSGDRSKFYWEKPFQKQRIGTKEETRPLSGSISSSVSVTGRPICTSAALAPTLTYSGSEIHAVDTQSQPLDFEEDTTQDDDAPDHGWLDFGSEEAEELSRDKCLDLYAIELKRVDAVTPIDSLCRKYIIPEFNKNWRTLSINKHCILERRSLLVRKENNDGAEKKAVWSYVCSCNPSREKFLKNLEYDLSCSEEELKSLQTPCLHIDALSSILDEFDLRNGILPSCGFSEVEYEIPSEILALKDSRSAVCVRINEDFGFVGTEMGNLRCFTCSFESRKCKHVEYLRQKLEISEDSVEIPDVVYEMASKNLSWQPSSSYVSKPVSTAPIPFALSIQAAQRQSKGYRQFLPEENGVYVLTEPQLLCEVCQTTFYDDISEGNTLLFTAIDVINCKVFSKRCPSCLSTRAYDGSNHGILNMGKFAVGYDVLKDYLYHFVLGNSCTLFGFYSIWKQKQIDYGNQSFERLIKYHHWRASWYAYLELLDIRYEDWDVCSKCGIVPETVVCDGTRLGFRKQLLLVAETQDAERERIKRKSKFSERLAIPDVKVRGLFERWVSRLTQGKDGGLRREEIETFESALKESYSSLFNLYCWINNNYDASIVRQIAKFLKCICSKSPVCSYIPPAAEMKDLLSMLDSCDVKRNPSLLLRLKEDVPFIYDVLNALPTCCFPSEWKDVFIWLFGIATNPFCEGNIVSGPEVSCEIDQLSFFPTLPKCRRRGCFEMDFCVKTANDDVCTKKSHGHPSLTPGIFTIYCPHGICYGFQAMESHESPNVPFTVFRTRFSQAPQTIIYDNSCNLHAYCLNRDPVFFKTTKFLVDRFHWRNHTGCCDGYNIRVYSKYDWINSQVNEQQNSTLKKLRSQLSYMGPENFMSHCKLFFWYRNRMTLKKVM